MSSLKLRTMDVGGSCSDRVTSRDKQSLMWDLECKSREEQVKIAAKFSLIIDNVGV